jgi:thiol-disulfide isomerase/thioredoxin
METVILVLALLIIAFLVYKLWKPAILPAKQVVPSSKANFYFFFTNWCGWSQKAMPEWTKLEEIVKSTPYFGTTRVHTIRVDAEKERKTADLYEIDGFPTVLLETSNGIYKYSKRPTAEGLLEFLRSTLGKESRSL